MLSSCTQTLELAPQIPRAITIEKPHEGPTWITHSAGIKDELPAPSNTYQAYLRKLQTSPKTRPMRWFVSW